MSNPLSDDARKRDIQMLKAGFSYREIAARTGTPARTVYDRNRLIYEIDVVEAFRRRMKRRWPKREVATPEFNAWFVGLFDGEGSFLISKTAKNSRGYPDYHLGIKVSLRDDDLSVLETLRLRLGIGTIWHQKARKRTNPSATWCVQTISDLVEVALPIFEEFMLLTKKRREYAIWKPLVRERYIETLAGTTRPEVSEFYETLFEDAIAAVQAIRRYHSAAETSSSNRLIR